MSKRFEVCKETHKDCGLLSNKVRQKLKSIGVSADVAEGCVPRSFLEGSAYELAKETPDDCGLLSNKVRQKLKSIGITADVA